MSKRYRVILKSAISRKCHICATVICYISMLHYLSFLILMCADLYRHLNRYTIRIFIRNIIKVVKLSVNFGEFFNYFDSKKVNGLFIFSQPYQAHNLCLVVIQINILNSSFIIYVV